MRLPSTTHHQPSTTSGFSLVELAVVMLVIVAVMGGMIAMLSAKLENSSYINSAARLRTLQEALSNYRLAYNRLPCPANSSSYAVTDANYGVEAATTGDCRGGSPAADTGDSSAAIGMVPVRTLGLPDEMALDDWGRRIRYAVAPAFTVANGFDGTVFGTTRLGVTNNDNAATVSSTAVFVLVSYGANGHGARGGLTGTLVNSGITNTNELLNCKCNSSGVLNGSADMDAFVQGAPKPDPTNALNNFDDLVVFSDRAALRSAAE